MKQPETLPYYSVVTTSSSNYSVVTSSYQCSNTTTLNSTLEEWINPTPSIHHPVQPATLLGAPIHFQLAESKSKEDRHHSNPLLPSARRTEKSCHGSSLLLVLTKIWTCSCFFPPSPSSATERRVGEGVMPAEHLSLPTWCFWSSPPLYLPGAQHTTSQLHTCLQ